MKRKAFAPAHITCFFQIHDNGSTGLGICLEKGMNVEISESPEMRIKVNGAMRKFELAEKVIEKYEKYLNEKISLDVDFFPQLPFGYGFGMSGAAALSLSLALNDFYAVANRDFAVETAKVSEIEMRTGLGDVIAQNAGGIVLRKIPGDICGYEKLEYSENVGVKLMGEIETKSVITNTIMREKISFAGANALEKIEPIFNNFKAHESTFKETLMGISKEFSIASGLAEKFEVPLEEGFSMVMLGKSLFSLLKKGDDNIMIRNEGAEVF